MSPPASRARRAGRTRERIRAFIAAVRAVRPRSLRPRRGCRMNSDHDRRCSPTPIAPARTSAAASASIGGRFVAETLMPLCSSWRRPTRRRRRTRPSRPSSTDLGTHYAGPAEPALLRRAADRASSRGRRRRRTAARRSTSSATSSTTPASHKINNCLGQILLARRMGKTRIIAETGAGQHGVAVGDGVRALRPALRRLHGRDRRRAAEAERLPHEAARRRGASRSPSGAGTLKDAMNEALRDWVANVENTYYLIGTAAGPAPLSGDGARLPVGDRQRGARADAGGAKAACPTRSSRRSAAARTPSACSTRSSTTATSRSTASRPAATGSTCENGHAASMTGGAPRRAARQPHLSPAGRRRADPRGPFDLGRPRLSGRRAGAFLAEGYRPRHLRAGDRRARRSTRSSSAPGSKASSRRSSRRTRSPHVIKLAPTMGRDKIIVMNMCGRGDKDVFTVAQHLKMDI